jgi:aspartate ammonia-lyase
MRYKSLVLAAILLAATAYAKEPKAYQSGKLLQMDSVQCGVGSKDDKNISEVVSNESVPGKTDERTCQEYVLQADQVIYRIRPRNEKHPVLLPVSDWAQFRLEKNRILLRVADLDSKEREFIVMSMTPRGNSTADARPARVNHLQ